MALISRPASNLFLPPDHEPKTSFAFWAGNSFFFGCFYWKSLEWMGARPSKLGKLRRSGNKKEKKDTEPENNLIEGERGERRRAANQRACNRAGLFWSSTQWCDRNESEPVEPITFENPGRRRSIALERKKNLPHLAIVPRAAQEKKTRDNSIAKWISSQSR